MKTEKWIGKLAAGLMFVSLLALTVTRVQAQLIVDAGPDVTVSAGADCTADVTLDGTGTSSGLQDLMWYTQYVPGSLQELGILYENHGSTVEYSSVGRDLFGNEIMDWLRYATFDSMYHAPSGTWKQKYWIYRVDTRGYTQLTLSLLLGEGAKVSIDIGDGNGFETVIDTSDIITPSREDVVLDGYLPVDEIFLKFQTARTDVAYLPSGSYNQVTIYDGGMLVEYTEGMPTLTPTVRNLPLGENVVTLEADVVTEVVPGNEGDVLYDADDSGVAGSTRFAVGDAYFIYKFDVPDGAVGAGLDMTLSGEYAIDVDPTGAFTEAVASTPYSVVVDRRNDTEVRTTQSFHYDVSGLSGVKLKYTAQDLDGCYPWSTDIHVKVSTDNGATWINDVALIPYNTLTEVVLDGYLNGPNLDIILWGAKAANCGYANVWYEQLFRVLGTPAPVEQSYETMAVSTGCSGAPYSVVVDRRNDTEVRTTQSFHYDVSGLSGVKLKYTAQDLDGCYPWSTDIHVKVSTDNGATWINDVALIPYNTLTEVVLDGYLNGPNLDIILWGAKAANCGYANVWYEQLFRVLGTPINKTDVSVDLTPFLPSEQVYVRVRDNDPGTVGKCSATLESATFEAELSDSVTITVVDTTPPSLVASLKPGVNPAGRSNPNASAGFRIVSITASDDCSNVAIAADIDGVPVADGETVKITVAKGQQAGKVTSTAGGVKHIVGPTGHLIVTATDDSGNSATYEASP